MKAKALRIVALVLLALLTTAAPCDPTGADTVYVFQSELDRGGMGFGIPSLPAIWFRADGFTEGSLTVRFSRDSLGNVVDGPFTLTNLSHRESSPGYAGEAVKVQQFQE